MAINLDKLYTKGKHKLLAIDPSGSHLAYAIVELDLDNKEVHIINAGMIWTPAAFERGERLRYMQSCIDSLLNNPPYYEYVVDAVYSEQFFQNPKMLTGGASIIPTINNFLEMACSETGIKYQELGPTTWRSILGIKATKDAKGKKDFKEPAKAYVERFIRLPEKITSNVDGRPRNLPHDLTDAICVALAAGLHHGCNKVSFANTWEHPWKLLNRFQQLAKGA